VMPTNPKNFNVDNVRVVKIMGGSLSGSRVVQGMVFGREPEGAVTNYFMILRFFFTVFFHDRHGEESAERESSCIHLGSRYCTDRNEGHCIDQERRRDAQLHPRRRKASRKSKPFHPIILYLLTPSNTTLQIFKEIADSGIKVVIGGSSIGELALHYLNRFNIAVLKVLSKFELRRLCRVVNATPLARIGAPTPEEAGFVDVFETVEIGGDRVTVLRQLVDGDEGYDLKGEKTKTATIVLRGATSNRLDDLERAIDDGVNVIKSLLKDPRLVPGAGASELELAKRVEVYGSGLKGLSQHAVKRYGAALEVVPRTLAENALGGREGNEVLSRLWAKHEEKGGEGWGVDVEVSDLFIVFCFHY
jgi:T-complex protein 1 subunit theta